MSVDTLISSSGLPSGDSVPPHGSLLIIDRLQRLVDIANYFKTWKQQVNNLHGFTKTQRSKMFLTHWLYTDLRRTCYGVVECMRHYITSESSRCWLFRRFTQDPIESLFGQIRSLCGSNINLDRLGVDIGMSEIRAKCCKSTL